MQIYSNRFNGEKKCDSMKEIKFNETLKFVLDLEFLEIEVFAFI